MAFRAYSTQKNCILCSFSLKMNPRTYSWYSSFGFGFGKPAVKAVSCWQSFSCDGWPSLRHSIEQYGLELQSRHPNSAFWEHMEHFLIVVVVLLP